MFDERWIEQAIRTSDTRNVCGIELMEIFEQLSWQLLYETF